MSIATLTIDLVMKLANLERDMGKAAQIAERNSKRMEEAFAGVKTSLAAIGSVLTVGAFAGMVRGVSEAGDQLQKLSVKSGIAVEELSKLQYAASLSDLSNEDLGASLIKLNKVMGEAADGSETATAALARFGIAPDSSMSSIEALRQIADKVKATGDETKVASALNDVFGKSFATLIPLLKGGSDGIKEAGDELERMGGVMSGELAEASETFNDNLTRLNTQLEALKVQTIGPLIPLFEQITTAMSDSSDKANDLAKSGGALQTVFETVAVLGANVAYVFKQTGAEIGGIAAQAAALASLDFDAVGNINDAMKEDAKQARIEVDALSYRLMNAKAIAEASKLTDSWMPRQASPSGGISDNPRPTQKPTGPTKPEKFDLSQFDAGLKAEEAYLSAMKAIADAQETARRSTMGLTEAQKKLLDLKQSDVWGTLSDEQKQAAEDQAKYADETIRAAESQDRLNSIIAGLDSSQVEKAWQDMELLNKALDRGSISQSQYSEAINKLFDGGNEKIEKQKSMAEELGLTFSSAFEDAIVKGEKFSDVLNGLAQDITRLLVRKNITEPLAESFGKLDFGSLFSANADGGVYSSPGLSAYSGSIVSKPTVFPFAKGVGLMGEAGAEAILPLKRGSDGKLGVSSDGSSVVVNVINNANGTKATQTQRSDGNGKRIIDVMIEQIDAAMADNVTRGNGRLPAAMESRYGLSRAAGAY